MHSLIHNMSAHNAQRQLNINVKNKSNTSEKLSSGYRINRAADDAAGLSISEKMRRQIRGLDQGVTNSQEGVSLCKVADSALSEVNQMLNRMTELSIQAANGTMSTAERIAIQDEISQLSIEINRIGKTTTYNEIPIFDLAGTPKEVILSMELIRSPSAANGYMSEAYQIGTKFYPAASMDFSAINSSNVKKLFGKTFSFGCTAACDETFKFTFIDGNGSQSSWRNVQPGPIHEYTIDIHGKSTGTAVLNTLFDFVHDNPPYPNPTDTQVHVGHANYLNKENDNTLIIRSESSFNTEEEAIAFGKSQYENQNMCKTDFAEVTGSSQTRIVNVLDIQFGGESGENFELEVDRMNSEILGIDNLSVTTLAGCNDAMNRTKDAMEFISTSRSKIGSQQNRLEANIAGRANTVENTTSAESRIRDMDMATGMVAYSMVSILEQTNEAMLAQANQSKHDIVNLIQ